MSVWWIYKKINNNTNQSRNIYFFGLISEKTLSYQCVLSSQGICLIFFNSHARKLVTNSRLEPRNFSWDGHFWERGLCIIWLWTRHHALVSLCILQELYISRSLHIQIMEQTNCKGIFRENLKCIFVCWRSRRILKFGHFAPLSGRERQRNAAKCQVYERGAQCHCSCLNLNLISFCRQKSSTTSRQVLEW